MDTNNICGYKVIYFNSKIILYYYNCDDSGIINLVYSCYEFDNQNEKFIKNSNTKIPNVSGSTDFIDSTNYFINKLDGLERLAFIIITSSKYKIYVLDTNLKIKKYAFTFSTKSQSDHCIGSIKIIDGPKIITVYENKILMADMNASKLNFVRFKLKYEVISILWSEVCFDVITIVLEVKCNGTNLIHIYESTKYSEFKYRGEIKLNSFSSNIFNLKQILEFNCEMLVDIIYIY